jgi:hypothetical protein
MGQRASCANIGDRWELQGKKPIETSGAAISSDRNDVRTSVHDRTLTSTVSVAHLLYVEAAGYIRYSKDTISFIEIVVTPQFTE